MGMRTNPADPWGIVMSLPSKTANHDATERPANPVHFSRWMTIPFIVIIGLIVWIGVLSDSSGRLTMPGLDSMLYVGAVIGVAALLAYADRKRNASGKNRKDRV